MKKAFLTVPAMLLAVSRLMFAWAEDGIFPRAVARVHPKWHTPHVAIVLSGLMATVGILGSHQCGKGILGIVFKSVKEMFCIKNNFVNPILKE